MKPRRKPISLTRNVMSAVQIFRRVEQRGACCSRAPRYCNAGDGGPYRNMYYECWPVPPKGKTE